MSTSFLTNLESCTPIFTREKLSPEHLEIATLVREFATEQVQPRRSEIDAFNRDLTLSLLQESAELGLLSAEIPEIYGGLGMDKTTGILLSETLAFSRCASFVVTLGVQVGIGMLPILYFGSEAQKKHYLPGIGAGTTMGAYCLTEPGAGSDALNIKTRADKLPDEEGWSLNGTKQFITNAGFADLFIVYAKVDGKHNTAFLVDRNLEGVTVGEEEKKMGLKGSSTASVTFENVRLPLDSTLGEIGHGHEIAFNILNFGRYKLGAMDLGMCKAVMEDTLTYAAERQQFGEPILNFSAIRRKLARDYVQVYGLDSIVYRTIGEMEERIRADLSPQELVAASEEFAVQTSMVKIYGSETLALVADDGVQIHGGYGFIEEYSVAAIYRDTRVDRIFEGTNEINRQIITGYIMKDTLMEQLAVRDTLKSGRESAPEGLSSELSSFGSALNSMKLLALQLFKEALTFAGQDLRHHNHLAEDLADIFTQIYIFDSTLLRINQGEIAPYQRILLQLIALDTRDLLRRCATPLLTYCEAPANLVSQITERLSALELDENRYAGELELAADLIANRKERLS
ncbi:MAG: acyl-CoA dehydrogenase family protein [Candidatus Delongbacteria bacterium]|nr:acyl-CoA dehydrogenase family protein [Candidatus Delongbacteria bacterium]